ncbi:MAG: RNase adapter RapZ [Bacilli bacterium]|jgi:UPF0042 nucleotide-binding protein|nr:RNase adapter RapZ [Bacilli bacterium]
MDNKELVLVCGISGAGKSITMAYLESIGYYCIDNLPVDLVSNTINVLNKEENYQYYAIAINSNVNEEKITNMIVTLRSYDWLKIKIVYLDVKDEILKRRFQITRKQHPFINEFDLLSEAVMQERLNLQSIRNKADLIIDTSKLTEAKLRSYLAKALNKDMKSLFRLCFVSYGYKFGIPQDLDYAFDVRFIPNPYYDDNMKLLTGNDNMVFDFVMKQKETQVFLNNLIPLLDYCIKEQQATNRSYLVIGFGCTGGHHRSVSLVNYLTEYYSNQNKVIKDHRDIEK